MLWLAPLLGSLSASAGELSWQWERPEPLRYHIEALVVTPTGLVFYGARNIEARSFKTGMALDTTCTGTGSGRSTVAQRSAPRATTTRAATLSRRGTQRSLSGRTLDIPPPGRLRSRIESPSS